MEARTADLRGWREGLERDLTDVPRLCDARGICGGCVRGDGSRWHMHIIAVILVVRTVEKVVSGTGHNGNAYHERNYLKTISGVTFFNKNVVVFFPKVF